MSSTNFGLCRRSSVLVVFLGVLSPHPKIPFPAAEATVRFQDDFHSGAFWGDLRPFISWILVSTSLKAPERRFLASRLRVPKFRSQRLGLEPVVLGQSRLRLLPAWAWLLM